MTNTLVSDSCREIGSASVKADRDHKGFVTATLAPRDLAMA
jgi:hypothetical protein